LKFRPISPIFTPTALGAPNALFLESNMADFNTISANAGSRGAAIDAGLRAHMNKVYGTMSIGMVITAVAAWAIAGLATTTDANMAAAQLPNGKLLTSFGLVIYTTWLKYVIMLAPLAVLFLGMGTVMRGPVLPGRNCSSLFSPL
jgi:FtsH-binding integral membrane protein